MKLFITGIAGLLGGNIAYLLSGCHHIEGIDRNQIDIPSVHIHKIDLRNFEKLAEIIKISKPDAVIHCAAATNVDWCEENSDEAFVLNTVITKELATICNYYNIQLVFISSDAVFDGFSEDLYTETDPVNPLNIYGKTKVLAENEVLKYPNNMVIRTNIYGYNMRQKLSIGEWILKSLKNDETLTLFRDVYFSPILVNDLAFIIEKMIEKKVHGLFHVCGTGSISKYEFGKNLQKIFEIPTGEIIMGSVEDFAFKACRSKHMGMSNEKVRKCLNISIRSPFESLQEFKRLYDSEYEKIIKSQL